MTSGHCFCATTWHGVTVAPGVNCQIYQFHKWWKTQKNDMQHYDTDCIRKSILYSDLTMQIEAIELTAITRQLRWIFCNQISLLWTIQVCSIMIQKRTSNLPFKSQTYSTMEVWISTLMTYNYSHIKSQKLGG